MKTSSLAIIFTIVLFSTVCFGQVKKQSFDQLAGRMINSVVQNQTESGTPVQVGNDQVSADIASAASSSNKIEKLVWLTTIKEKQTKELEASKELKRIIFILNRPFGKLNYDSDNAFESTDGSERLVKNFTNVLNKPSLKIIGEVKPASNDKVNLLWNKNLPVFDSSLYWDGLVFTTPFPAKLEKDVTWNTTLELNDRTVQNMFKILEIDQDKIKVSLNSKEVLKEVTAKSLNTDGSPVPVALGMNAKRKEFTGSFVVDRKNMLISTGTFKIQTVSNLSFNGSDSERTSFSTTTINNTIK